jgi:hypothetical protein
MKDISRLLAQGSSNHADFSSAWFRSKEGSQENMRHYTYFHVLSQDARINDRFTQSYMRYTSLGALRHAMGLLKGYPCDAYIFWSDMQDIQDVRYPGPFCYCAQAYEGKDGTACARLYWHDASNVPHEIDPCNLLAHFTRC